MNAKGWAVPPAGGFFIRNPNEHLYEMSDGQIYTAMELVGHPRNIHDVTSTTMRVRLASGMRDLDQIFRKRMRRARP